MLKELQPTSKDVEVQETAFSVDVLGRYIHNTWDEVISNGGAPFDVIVIGAGMFGAYCAEKIYRQGADANLRVLVLEAGSFLVSEHVQNLARVGLNAAGPILGKDDTGKPRERVWGLPWRSNTAFPGLAYCLGGRSLYWGGWAPRLTDADLAQWPTEVADYLKQFYKIAEIDTGVDETTDYISGPLYDVLIQRFKDVQPSVPTVDEVVAAPLAVQGKAPASGLFSFDKYSSAPILVDAIREAAGRPDSSRRLFLVPKAHVVKLLTNGGLVTQIELQVNGQQQFLSTPNQISANCAVVIASGTIETTRLALESFPTALMGRNLMGHLRSNTTVRIKRTALTTNPADLPNKLEAAALLVRGSTPQGRYHLQVTAAAVSGQNPEEVMFRMIPDIELLGNILANQNSEWIVITLRGIGEMLGDRQASPQSAATSWMDLSPFERDEFGLRRAWVNLVSTQQDNELWGVMDKAALDLALKLAKDDPSNIEYLYDGKWNKTPPPAGKVQDKLGTTHHEAGTLWMGEGHDAAKSVTNADGRFHHVGNAYVAGPAIFPTLGSANPALTGLTLAYRTAGAIVREFAPQVETGFTTLFDGTLTGWQMAGSGKFNVAAKNVLESEGGIGVLWYTQEQFGNFVLKADWRASDINDNSGIFLRFPALSNNDPANDWKLAADKGYEVQIDDRGFNPDTNATGDPLHQTGAIYTFAPSSKIASKPVGQWNTFEIEVSDASINVKLNNEIVTSFAGDGSRPSVGHIGLQNHHTGSRVQFRNIRIKKL